MKKAAEVLSHLLDKGGAGSQPFHSLFGAWQEIAGASLSEHCQVYELQHHSLLVEADHPGWMQLLLMQKKPLLAKLRKRFPELELRDLKVRVRPAVNQGRPPRGASAGQPGRPAGVGGSGRRPQKDYSAETEQALAAVSDPELKEKLRMLLEELERRIDTSDDK